MSATKTLAHFIADTRYEQLPAPVVEAAKVAILDGVATMLGGSTQELATIIGQYVKAFQVIALLEDLEHVPDISALMQRIGHTRIESSHGSVAPSGTSRAEG